MQAYNDRSKNQDVIVYLLVFLNEMKTHYILTNMPKLFIFFSSNNVGHDRATPMYDRSNSFNCRYHVP